MGATGRVRGGTTVRGTRRRQGLQPGIGQEGLRAHQHVRSPGRPWWPRRPGVATRRRGDAQRQHPRPGRGGRVMNGRGARWLAWTIAVLVVLAFVAGAILGFARGSFHMVGLTPQTWLDVLTQSPFLAFPVVGAVIIGKQPRNPVGWLLSAVGVSATVGNFTNEYALASLLLHRHLPLPQLAAWLASWVWAPAAAIAPLVILLFPDWHFLSRRWRLVGIVTVVDK